MSLSANKLDTKGVNIQQLNDEVSEQFNVKLDVLRLDKLHPIISGNKIFKLKYYIEDAIEKSFCTIQTFGGFYSNHIAATAYAAKFSGLKSIGIIRGVRPPVLTDTLSDAEANGMELKFVSNEEYNERKRNEVSADRYVIPEGGYGTLGMSGAAEISALFDRENYTHIITAVGTGTTLAGLINASSSEQKIMGISALKGAFSLEEEVKKLIHNTDKDFQIIHDYHFGGFGKHPAELLEFMKTIWMKYELPTDIVYTSKTLFGIFDLLKKSVFEAGSKILMIHTGGLQGNRSLPVDSLPFL